jgi:peptidoglycan hydrolase-like protein with peptidoglycan-binding domain
MRRRKLLKTGVAVGLLALGGAGLAAALLLSRDNAVASSDSSPGPAPATAEVVRTNLVTRSEVEGTLGFADPFAVLGVGPGTITWLPKAGHEVSRGHRMYEVDGRPVPLFYGTTPMWRSVQFGVSEDKDVLEVERNLTALGYGDGLAVDGRFTAWTAKAIRDWQDDLGVPKTGRIAPSDVVMQPGRLRISSVDGLLGGPVGGKILSATETDRQIVVKLPVTDEGLAKVGQRATVDLPGGRTTTGTIFKIGTAATAGGGKEGGGEDPGADTESATIPVYLKLDKPKTAGRLDGAPVTVGFTGDVRKNVLAVPVNALLATSKGGYQVEIVDAGGTRRRVAVELGTFAEGKVEVSGAGLEAGMRVQVPRS